MISDYHGLARQFWCWRDTTGLLMDIELLQTFLEVKNTRHFSRAAENLYLSQAAVSARVKQLEEFLGVSLFIRNRNNIQLTAEGERLLPHAETMLLAWSRARQDVALETDQKYQLSIGSTAGLWEHVLQQRLSTIHRDFPDLALRAEAYSSRELLRRVTERTLDLAVMYETATNAGIEAMPLGKLQLQLLTSREHPGLQQALQTDYVYVDWGTAFAMFHARRFGDTPPASLHTNMASVAIAYLQQHAASAYLPASLLQLESPRQLAAVKNAPSFSRELYMVYRGNSDKRELIESLLASLRLS